MVAENSIKYHSFLVQVELGSTYEMMTNNLTVIQNEVKNLLWINEIPRYLGMTKSGCFKVKDKLRLIKNIIIVIPACHTERSRSAFEVLSKCSRIHNY